MKTLHVIVTDEPVDDSIRSHKERILKCVHSEYTVSIPDGLEDDTLHLLIAHGLLFDHDWSMDGTSSYYWIE